MITRLGLEMFKGFRAADIPLGPFTVIIGANATGKSNIGDALRFLHGVSRGYTLAEIVGEKWGPGGALAWAGVRGGEAEVIHQYGDPPNAYVGASVAAAVATGDLGDGYRFRFGRWRCDNQLHGKPDDLGALGRTMEQIPEDSRAGEHPPPHLARFARSADAGALAHSARRVLDGLASLRFLDLDPRALRMPSVPAITELGDRGENLSSVLQAICKDEARKRTLLEWLGELTPTDCEDLEFPAYDSGRVQVRLMEGGGRRVSAESASEGTLRFLGLLAALLGPEEPRTYFIEELESGIHPARLALLADLIERQTAGGTVQVIATTHSPQLVRMLSPESLESVILTYRSTEEGCARATRIVDIPHAREVIEAQGVGRLVESGWFEDVAEFGLAGGVPA